MRRPNPIQTMDGSNPSPTLSWTNGVGD